MNNIILQAVPFLFFFISQYFLSVEKYKIGWSLNIASCMLFVFVNYYFGLYIYSFAQFPLIFWSYRALSKIE